MIEFRDIPARGVPAASGYRLEHVHGHTTPSLRDEIVGFWLRNNALPPGTNAQARARTLVYVARNPAGTIAGVTSAYVADLQTPGNPHYFYRMLVQAADRSFGLTYNLWRRTGDALEAAYAPGAPRGLVIIAENSNLTLPWVRRALTRGRYEAVGQTTNGMDVWVRRFAAS
jgi:hypothetical protein